MEELPPQSEELFKGENPEAVENASAVIDYTEEIQQAELFNDDAKVSDLKNEQEAKITDTLTSIGIDGVSASNINNISIPSEQKNILQTFLDKFISTIKYICDKFNTTPEKVREELKSNPSESVSKFGSYAKYIVTLAILGAVIAGITELGAFLKHAADEATGCYQIDISRGTNTKMSCGSQAACSCAQFTQLNNQCGGMLTPCSGSLSEGSGVVYQWKVYTPADILSGMIKSVGQGIGGFIGGVSGGIFDSIKKYIIWIILLIVVLLLGYGAYRFMSK